jgi:hypothetical protein
VQLANVLKIIKNGWSLNSSYNELSIVPGDILKISSFNYFKIIIIYGKVINFFIKREFFCVWIVLDISCSIHNWELQT